jgi:hypothetical protein
MSWSLRARFYPLLYMLTWVCHAQDWETGVELSNSLMGKFNRLQVHHIFPKALLYRHGYSKADVNAIANLTFLTQETNLLVSDRDPAEYLEAFAHKHPGAVASHWIPMDRDLWRVENYYAFLATRREHLAQAANAFLDGLLAGAVPERATYPSVLEQRVMMVPGGVESEEEERLIQECNTWIGQQGLPEGEYLYELTDALTGEPLAVLDLAWTSGLQEGYSQPMALLIGEGQEMEEAANCAGYRYFTDVNAFRAYVQQEILAIDSASEEGIAASRDALEQ